MSHLKLMEVKYKDPQRACLPLLLSYDRALRDTFVVFSYKLVIITSAKGRKYSILKFERQNGIE